MSIDKREHIINVAIELFAEKGFEGTSIRDLAQAADVNIAMINYYFGSKDKLFGALVEMKATYMKGKIEELESDATLSEIEKLDAIIEGYVDRIMSNPKFHRVLQQELLVTKRIELHQNVIAIFSQNIKNIVAIIERGIAKKIFQQVDAQLLYASILGTINQVMTSKLMCTILINATADSDPYTNPVFKERVTNHIKQMVHAQLLNK